MTDNPAAAKTAEPCAGFPDQCPNLIDVDPDPAVAHGGGVRCGCDARAELEGMAFTLATGSGVVEPRTFTAALDRYAAQVLKEFADYVDRLPPDGQALKGKYWYLEGRRETADMAREKAEAYRYDAENRIKEQGAATMSDQDRVISAQELEGVTITAAQPLAPSIVLPFNNKPMVTIRPDGTLEFGEDYQPDEAARLFWEAVQRFQPTLEQQTGIRQVEAKLRAGAFRDGADRIRRTDLPDDYIDTFDAGASWAATLMDRAAREADPK
ncbi:MAG: hypothetical protein HOY75_08145 [Streptomyces sp.]|nr:hypothetical protein [Streptomyces sp.]